MEFVKSFKQTKLIKYLFIALLGSILLAISSKIKIPFYPVPMTMQTFVVLFIGVSVVNALSEKLSLNIYRDGKEYEILFKNGETIKPLKKKGSTKQNGTKINFLPSKEVFSSLI